MKRKFFLSFLAIFCLGNLKAQDGPIGLGIIVGEPTGITAKYWITEKSAWDAAVAWSFVGSGNLHVHADYLIHFAEVDLTKGKLPIYAGIGGRVVFATNTKLSVRIPIGANYIFDGDKFGVFIEVVPMLDLTPSTDLDFGAGLGGRYYF